MWHAWGTEKFTLGNDYDPDIDGNTETVLNFDRMRRRGLDESGSGL
jgi:hypothetical protein